MASINIKEIWKCRLATEVYEILKPLQIGDFVKDRIKELLLKKNDKPMLKRVFCD